MRGECERERVSGEDGEGGREGGGEGREGGVRVRGECEG